MNADILLRMAQLQTLLDTIELLLYLRNEGSAAHHKQIDDMLNRLSNMAKTMELPK